MSRLLVGIMAGLFVGSTAAACNNARNVDDTHRMVERYFPLDLTSVVTTKSAACETGEVLLGAGHRVDRAAEDLSNAVAILVNRPEGANGWRLTAVRGPTTPPGSLSASLYLYCLRRTDGQPITLTGQTAAGADTRLTDSGTGVAAANVSAACGDGQTLTGGGFELTLGNPDPLNRAASYNGWIWSSRPATDRDSWTVEATYINNGEAFPRVRAYARCVRDPDSVLRPVDAEDATASRTTAGGFGFAAGAAGCGRRAFASGGGFAFAGNSLIPHSIIKDQIASDFAGWAIRGVYGAETGTSGSLSIRPLCFEALAIEKPSQIDLRPLIGANPSGSGGFTFTVVNAGTLAAPASVAEVVGNTTVRTAIPPLAPGQSAALTVNVTPLCTTDCSIRVTVDPDRTLTESNENNNTAEWTSVG